MDKFVVVVFPDQANAYKGKCALQDLEAEGSLSVYDAAVVTRGTDGILALDETAPAVPWGTMTGTLIGGLIGLLAGPAGAAIGAGGGAAIGAGGGALAGGFGDLVHYGVNESFFDEVAPILAPGKTALIAEVDEEWVSPLDTRMEALGGEVFRRSRMNHEDELYDREIATLKADLVSLQTELKDAREEDKARLKARVESAKAKLKEAQSRTEAWIEDRHIETEAKIKAHQRQAADASANRKQKVEKRVAELREDHEKRTAKLKESMALAKEALKP